MSEKKFEVTYSDEAKKVMEPKEIVVHGYRPGRAVNSLSYTCPTCGAHIGRYPFCEYCGQALELEVEVE